MRMCNDTITLFNSVYLQSSDCDAYIRTVISGVSWFCDIASTIDTKGLKAANKYIIRIPDDAYCGGKRYLPPQEYARCADREMYFTLQVGDLIVHGEVDDENPRPADLHANYEVTTISGVTDNRRGNHAKHFKVVGA